MRPDAWRTLGRALGLTCALLLLSPAPARSTPDSARRNAGAPSRRAGDTGEISDSTSTDHDAQPIPQPPDWQPNYWGQRVHQGLVKPISHVFDIPDKLLWVARMFGADTRREAVNVSAFDEVPNSTWYTNRNHTRAVRVAEMRQGPDSVFLPTKPWTVKHAKQGGWSAGFQIQDADGKKWLVKLDSRGYPQLSSGADMVARTLLHAAGYNVTHNEPVRFRREDVAIAPALSRGEKGERFTEGDLDSVLAQGAVFPDGSYSASASLFLEGHALGSPSMSRLRPEDPNDWYAHANRREIRGLFVLCAWINDWDTEDHQFLDMFVDAADSVGHVKHYILDAGSSFGAAASGPRQRWTGYENMLDLKWTARRVASLGFAEEPWRRAREESGLPSIGRYGSDAFEPRHFKTLVPQPAFRAMTDRDGYWGAKIVASFSDEQIAAAVQAARYEDPRASEYMVSNLIVRRDKIARYWFGRVAPLDFFSVQDGTLEFHDLAVDVRLAGARDYDVAVTSRGGRRSGHQHVHLSGTTLPLAALGLGASRLSLVISIAGDRAKPTRVELTRKDAEWIVTRVRHG